jgi:PPOX class probable F420-dependent enzyme
MLDENIGALQRTDDPFTHLYPHEFMRLTTFRRNGEAVPTTVWFAQQGGVLYVTTQATTGKARRIRINQRVLVAPSDRLGQAILGDEVEARAHELAPAEHERAREALRRKYGAQFEAMTARMLGNTQRTYLAIEPRAK